MIKQKNNIDVIEFAEWLVTLKRIKNTLSGAPKYEATIINIGPQRGMDRAASVYTFTGHYYSERMEAEFILEHHLKENGYIGGIE